jgi:FkbM family methyltransferase
MSHVNVHRHGFSSNPGGAASSSSHSRTLLPSCGLGARQRSSSSRVLPPRTPDANCRFTLQGRCLNRERMAPGATPESVMNVPTRTLDSILIEAGTPSGFVFLSIDVEGHEIEVLRGFDIGRWRPRFILLEDHVADLSRHRYLTAAGYRIIRRYENNGWYVPRDSTVGATTWSDRWEILRKYYLALPFRVLRNMSRRIRKPVTS